MHLYNAWLPLPVAESARREAEAFTSVVRSVKESWKKDDPDSIEETLKWISIVDLFIHGKSDICVKDVKEFIEFGLEFFHSSQDMYTQARWGYILNRLLKKHQKNLSLSINWRPFYDTLIQMHFKRNTGPEGWRLRDKHLRVVTNLIKNCRKFFPAGSSYEIWTEFSGFLINPWSHSAFQGAGFLNLFLSMNLENQSFFTSEWIEKCLEIWESVPNCNNWNNQWLSIFARCIKYCTLIDWQLFLPRLFTLFLNMFQVSPSYSLKAEQFIIMRPQSLRSIFYCYGGTPKSIAKSIVYLLRNSSKTQQYFQIFVDKLEQFFHPSNGGHWTDSLDLFFWHLVMLFKKLLSYQTWKETKEGIKTKEERDHLGKLERVTFCKTVLRLMDKAQYSKDEDLSETVLTAISILSYVEPSLLLPFISSRFHLALETTTATHQLRIAMSSVASAGRAFALASNFEDLKDLVVKFLSFALLALDANDPPKTIAAMELICSIFSNIFVENICLSEWLDEFFSRLFLLLRNIESNNIVHDGLKLPSAKKTFLSEENSYYSLMLQILLGKLPQPLFKQAMEKISNFVNENFLPGVTNEICKLCSACVETESQLAGSHLISKIIKTTISSLKEISVNETVSRSLEMVTVYYLKILSSAISHVGNVLINYQDELKEILSLAFNAHSWKINQAGGTMLLSLLRSLVFYYPIDQYKSLSDYESRSCFIDPWISSKGYKNGETETDKMVYSTPKWHISNKDEVNFANELLDIHLKLASEDLIKTCQDKIFSKTGVEKEHLKVTLLRIKCSLKGVLSCLPDINSNNKSTKNSNYFSIAGSIGVNVGSSDLREKISQQMHSACKYLLKERGDDSILLELTIHIMDVLANYGSKEFEEWCSKDHSIFDLNSLMEPPFNFIHNFHTLGHKRPRWALVEKVYMNNIWRASQSSYHIFRIDKSILPSEYIIHLMQDLVTLSLHNYEGVRFLAVKSISRMLKRYPSLVSNCITILSDKLQDKTTAEHEVLGSCMLLSQTTLLKHLNIDGISFSSFIIAILESFHHESLKSQKAITELFVEFNKNYTGMPVEFLKNCSKFSDLVSKIRLLNFSSTTLQWRYSLMADRILLLLILSCQNNTILPLKLHAETTGHFLKNLKSQLPQSRMLSISALNSLLKSQNNPSNLIKQSLSQIILNEKEILNDIFTELSFLHQDYESDDSANHKGLFLNQSNTDEEITLFFYDFSSSWPRTPNWIFLDSFPNNTSFNSRLARVFKRLVQECGTDIINIIQNMIEKFSCENERSKRSVATEALAGLIHSNIVENSDKWVNNKLEDIINESSFESVNEWADCIIYAVTGKGKAGNEIPVFRERILNCLVRNLNGVRAAFVAKRYYFILVAFNEISPAIMSNNVVKFHEEILEELLGDVNHFSPQVREVVGAALCVVSSNLRYFAFSQRKNNDNLNINQSDKVASLLDAIQKFTDSKEYTETDQKETMLHFMTSCLVSGRSSFLLDMIVSLIYPVLSLQDTSNKELSKLARDAFELLSWRIFPRPYLESAIKIIISASSDSNWRTRYASLTYIEAFMYRHTFTLLQTEKLLIWDRIKKLLSDNQVEVREHATKVLASLMKGGEEEFSRTFREESYSNALLIINTKNHRCTLASRHGLVLALAASVLSVPYDMPSWLPDHVTLLAKFITEPYPINITVTKTVAEFRRSHADTWDFQKCSFTEEQIEVLSGTSLSSSYFA